MVSSRAKTPSGAAEAIPMPTEMDSRVVENERRMVTMVGRTVENKRRMVAMVGRAVEIERRDGAMVGRAAEIERRDGGDDRRHNGRNGQSGGDSEPSGEGQKRGSACKHCLSGLGKSTCP